ncbi:MAG TPA: hypothetical protein VMW56_16770 [Candidatus Margulisiibacteriota bacterium]|nr:hypothetical protein [Candidatus Margulisiibacteriota bacterium]
MSDSGMFYEENQDLGEVVSNGLRYRVFFDSKRHRTVCVLVAGQQGVARSIMPTDSRGSL